MNLDNVADRVHRRLLDEEIELQRIDTLISEEAPLLLPDARAQLHRQVVSRVVGLGVLDQFFDDDGVSEIMINGPGAVWVERAGAVEVSDVEIGSGELDRLVERVLAPVGRAIDPLRPWVDAALADGSRINIVAAPIAVDGPYVTIRRFAVDRPPLSDFASGSMLEMLHSLVLDEATVLISGGTGAGKTSLLNALAGELPDTCRIVTVEDTAELDLGLTHVVRLEGRPAGSEGVGMVAMADLVRTALRMRPDRLIVGEVRGPEAFDLLQAFNTGHRGGLSTIHANGPVDAIRRLAMLVLSAGVGVPASVIDEQLTAAIDAVVHVARTDGQRREVVAIERLVGAGRLEPWGPS